ncbi:MAG: hypothetical protein PHX88_12500, partial [Methanoculleus horonobensis]|nr:hypothetical protein [Methanoculleus horonobensis]
YSETHHLNVDDAGLASVHVAVHLQDADPRIARLLVLRVLDAAAAVADAPEQGILGQVVRPQTSGPCVHLDQATDDDLDEVRALGYVCEQPDGECPHIEAPDVLCPIKDACYAMRAVARLREVCEAEQDEQDADMAAVAPSQTYETAAPEWVEPEPEEAPVYTTPARPKGRAPAHVKEWTAEEDAAIRPATTAAESVPLYRSAVPDSGRSDVAIRTQWYKKVRPGLCEARDPLPDFVGDVVPVTQCEEPVFLPGDRVRLVNNPDIVGEVVYVAANGRYASVQFPGPGPAKVCAIDLIEGVGA